MAFGNGPILSWPNLREIVRADRRIDALRRQVRYVDEILADFNREGLIDHIHELREDRTFHEGSPYRIFPSIIYRLPNGLCLFGSRIAILSRRRCRRR